MYSFKNPKQKPRDRGASMMQPQRISYADLAAPVTSADFLKQTLPDVREDEVFSPYY